MSYKSRFTFLITIDSLIVLLSIYLSHFFLNPYAAKVNLIIAVSSLVLLGSHHLFSYVFRIYRSAWRYTSMEELAGIFTIVTSSVLLTVMTQLVFFHTVYERALIIAWMLHILFLGGVRFACRFTLGLKRMNNKLRTPGKRTLIIGAGDSGRILARQLKATEQTDLIPVAFADDNLQLKNLAISGIDVKGTVDELSAIVKGNKIEHIIIAMPSACRKRIKEVITQAKLVCDNVQILPKIEDLVLGKVSISAIKDVSVEDLLGREEVELDVNAIADKINGRTVLVTGAGGSIGSEICRQAAQFNPSQIVLLGHGEYSIYKIERELKQRFKHIDFPTVIADIQDYGKMVEVMEQFQPEVVYHAAAHKHVPLMERNPEAAVKNNIIGTKNVAEAASIAHVNTFVMISTDKAVNPTSVMGATKRIAEQIVQHMDTISSTRFVAVRFGNVLGSRGSVIPLFKEQIKNGGPVTVTHPEMVRYFMTIPEASRLVIQASALANGGEIFVLDMGEPVKIVDLAKNLIRYSGFENEEIGIEYSGIRPGEKLYEELLNENEVHPEQIYPKIYVGKSVKAELAQIKRLINGSMDISDAELKKMLLFMTNEQSYESKEVEYV